ncbi:hypothetical protein AB3S75_017245 [Citrus x aurantiifolia]
MSTTAVTTVSAKETATATTITHSLLHYLYTFVSLLTVNPFAKLTTDDFSVKTPSWTREFIGALRSYSFPSSPHTLKLRVHENVKRYARNYAFLFILVFACSLYIGCSYAPECQMALFCALSISYIVMILLAAFCKLSPSKQPSRIR